MRKGILRKHILKGQFRKGIAEGHFRKGKKGIVHKLEFLPTFLLMFIIEYFQLYLSKTNQTLQIYLFTLLRPVLSWSSLRFDVLLLRVPYFLHFNIAQHHIHSVITLALNCYDIFNTTRSNSCSKTNNAKNVPKNVTRYYGF